MSIRVYEMMILRHTVAPWHIAYNPDMLLCILLDQSDVLAVLVRYRHCVYHR